MIKTLQKVCIEGTYLSAMKAIYVKPKPNTGRTDAEAETPILRPPVNTLMLGKTEGRIKGMAEDKMVGWYH